MEALIKVGNIYLFIEEIEGKLIMEEAEDVHISSRKKALLRLKVPMMIEELKRSQNISKSFHKKAS
jgi:hypothetical protein